MSYRRSRLWIESLERRRMLHGDDIDHGADDAVGADAVSDFLLTDVNATSDTYQQLVSPRQFLGSVSGWYFGHAS